MGEGLETFGKYLANGAKLGGATATSRQMVALTRKFVQERMGPEAAAFFEGEAAEEFWSIALPSLVYFGTIATGSKIPGSDKILRVSGFAIQGAAKDGFQHLFEALAPLLTQLVKLADDVENGVAGTLPAPSTTIDQLFTRTEEKVKEKVSG